MHDNNDVNEEMMNGRTTNSKNNIPDDLSTPKSPKTPQAVIVEKRNSMRQEHIQKEHNHNGVKISGSSSSSNNSSSNHLNNNKVNSACLNNLILPLLSEVNILLFFIQ
jgi:hypothetical protein